MGNSQQKPSQNREILQQNVLEEETEATNGIFTCEICIEPMSASHKFKNKNLCTHPFCKDCIAKYIEAKVQEHNTAKIECPGLNCEQFLDPFSCKSMIPESLFSKWCDILCNDYVLGFERSYCPNRNCMALVVNECERIGRVKKAQCPNCKRWFCFQCKLAWHAGYNCQESRNLRNPDDIMFGQLVERMNWARCPGCGSCVERNEGCSVIICRCKTCFCCKCGGKCPSGCLCKGRAHIYFHCNAGNIIILTLLLFISVGVFEGILYAIKHL